MGWVKLDDQFFRHPKVVGAGRDARLLYLAGLCYCGSNLTDGAIPAGAIRLLAAEAEIAKPGAAADRLVEQGLWIRTATGFTVHDYLEHNRSSASVQSERDAASARMRRNRSPEVRPNIDRSSEDVRKQDKSKSREDTEENGENPPLAPQTEEPPDPPSEPVKTPRVIPHRLPETWRPSEDDVTWACRTPDDADDTSLGLPAEFVRSETLRFIDYWLGAGKPKANWTATWRGWMRREAQQGRVVPLAVNGARSSPRNQSDVFQAIARGEL